MERDERGDPIVGHRLGEELRALRLGTGDAQLIEHTENDDFWGNGGDGSAATSWVAF